MLALIALCCFITTAGGETAADDDDHGGGYQPPSDADCVSPPGPIAEGTSTYSNPTFPEAYTVTKDVIVCFDPALPDGGDMEEDDNGNGGMEDDEYEDDGDGRGGMDGVGDGRDGNNHVCDPFPEDGMFTYIYQLCNADTSIVPILRWELDTGIDNAIAFAGVLPGVGEIPCAIEVEGDGTLNNSRATFIFADDFVCPVGTSDPLDPGECSIELYIVSPLGPDIVNSTVVGDFALDAPSENIGPAVECEFCGRDENPDDPDDPGDMEDDSMDESDPGNPSMPGPCFYCPTGLAVGPECGSPFGVPAPPMIYNDIRTRMNPIDRMLDYVEHHRARTSDGPSGDVSRNPAGRSRSDMPARSEPSRIGR